MNYDYQPIANQPNDLNYQNNVQPSYPNSLYYQLQQYVSSFENSSYLTIYLVIFIIAVLILLIIYFVYSCLRGPAAKSSLESAASSWRKDYVPFFNRKSKRLKNRLNKISDALSDAVVTDNHSMQSDDYEDFLRYKAKMMKYRQKMEAQRKKQNRLKSNKNLINYHFLNSDPVDDYKRMTKEQISKLLKREQDCLIDLDGIEDGRRLNDKYQNQIQSPL